MFRAIGERPLYNAIRFSGLSLLTLGFALMDNLAEMILAFSEATLVLDMVALLILFLPPCTPSLLNARPPLRCLRFGPVIPLLGGENDFQNTPYHRA